MKTIRISNRNARPYVQAKRKFRGHNTHGDWNEEGTAFVVWSYCEPIYVWAEGIWFGNSTKFSVTTSKHQSQLHPLEEVVMIPSDQIIYLVHEVFWEDKPMAEIVAAHLAESLPAA